VAGDVISQGGGFLVGGAGMFLVYHSDPRRAFISKLLSPHSHDASHYQARELSHFFETFDARFIYWCATHNHPHFYSLMNFVFLVLLSLAHWHYTTKYFRMDPLVSILLIGLFWTTPSIFFSGIYVRVAKQGAA